MNMEHLDELINRYEENYEMINNQEHEEFFKWKAVQCFRSEWENRDSEPFSEWFQRATKESSVLINNSMISPTTGIVKMAEKRPEEVKRLFFDVLWAEYHSISELQEHMDTFLEEIEKIRQQLFPKFYRYKQERHAASCYLAFYQPETHFIYRYSEAEEFAKHVEYGRDLGSGANFSLENYYAMAEDVVRALKEHSSLIEKYHRLIENNAGCYQDESLHIMAFDLMYCCRNYNFYQGMNHLAKKESIRVHSEKMAAEKEREERRRIISDIESRLHAIDVQMEEYQDISLIDVEVYQMRYGKGIVIEQEGNKVKVQFDERAVSYVIDKKFPMRPRFEDDESILEAFTILGELQNEKKKLREELKRVLSAKKH